MMNDRAYVSLEESVNMELEENAKEGGISSRYFVRNQFKNGMAPSIDEGSVLRPSKTVRFSEILNIQANKRFLQYLIPPEGLRKNFCGDDSRKTFIIKSLYLKPINQITKKKSPIFNLYKSKNF